MSPGEGEDIRQTNPRPPGNTITKSAGRYLRQSRRLRLDFIHQILTLMVMNRPLLIRIVLCIVAAWIVYWCIDTYAVSEKTQMLRAQDGFIVALE